MASSRNLYGDYAQEALSAGKLLVPDISLIRQRAFWPAYFFTQGAMEMGLLERYCRVSVTEIRDLLRVLGNSERWPTLNLGLIEGKIWLVFRNEPDDRGVDFVYSPSADIAQGYRLSWSEGGVTGPGLSWPELTRAVSQSRWSPVGLTPDERLLLLMPACGDKAADGAVVSARIVSALAAVGIGAHAHELLGYLFGDAGLWIAASWGEDDSGVMVCDGEWSPRNPKGSFALSPDQRSAVSRALAARP